VKAPKRIERKGIHSNKNIPVVILCGGMGSRLSEYTEVPPKPLVEIGGKPILWHIMKHYARYGFHEFILALGYKGEQIKRYFHDFYTLGQDFKVSLKNGRMQTINHNGREEWNVHLVDSGLASLTGGRLKRLETLIGKGRCLMTYGHGVCDVDIDKLLKFYRAQKGLVTLTAVRPPARFGGLTFD
jgi:glucose-1-phosphate cytidylyltransferase